MHCIHCSLKVSSLTLDCMWRNLSFSSTDFIRTLRHAYPVQLAVEEFGTSELVEQLVELLPASALPHIPCCRRSSSVYSPPSCLPVKAGLLLRSFTGTVTSSGRLTACWLKAGRPLLLRSSVVHSLLPGRPL